MEIMEIVEENIDNQLVEEEKDKKICLFKNLVKIYKHTELELIECEISENQKIRKAIEPKDIQKINILVNYYLELKDTLGSLDKYIICQKHYNQVIRNDNFIERLQKNLKFSKYKQQIKKLEVKNNELIAKNNELIVENNQLKK
ncbi:7368_t:CDS:2 [Racocetra fulgida]|uniref:7368_t:CDS:1 n=1 Tax=Racocetra fulgida TaxID=60492 RepID=A0A9N9GB93_9GLOM|nr:7368_t:CDS:2 [Racocetra fulgida]